MQGECIIDGGDIFEMNRVGNLEALHAVSVSPLLEVHFECSSTPIAVVSTNLAFVLDSEAMQLV